MTEHSKSILVIDDDPIILGILKNFLVQQGYVVRTSTSAKAGLERLEHDRPDLVLTDLRMPDVDGIEVLCQVGKSFPDTPVIVISGEGCVEDVVQALRLGAWDYLTKPVVEMSMVTHAVERCLERARLRRENRMYQQSIENEVRERTRELERELAERLRVQEALRQEQIRFEQMVELNSDNLWIYEADSNLNLAEGYIAPTIDRMLGLPRGTINNRFDDFIKRIYPADLTATLDALKSALAEKPAMASLEYRVYHANGSLRWFLSKASAHTKPNGNAVLYGITADITDQKISEEALKQSEAQAVELAKQAQSASEAKSRFMANVSHELRTPMNGVIGFAQLLACTPMDNEQKFLLDTLTKSGQTLLRVINDILDFSRIEAGRLRIAETDFDLRDLVQDFASAISLQAHEKNLLFNCSIALSVPHALCGDPGRIRQVLTNLVGNAIKFTDKGEVSAIVERISEADALTYTDDVSTERNPCGGPLVYLRFTVRDTGIGIPRDKLEKIFESFEQADGSYTRRFGGTGLGLAISRALARLMGGDVAVESVEGHGATFRFDVPLCLRSEEQVSRVDPAHPAGVRIKKKRGLALIVEDNPVNQLAAELMLKELGIPSDTVANGREAIDSLSQKPYDIVFMDIQMPIMDGIEATRRIRAGEAGKGTSLSIPIVAMTAYAMQGDRERFLEAGMDDSLSKPVGMAALSSIVERWAPVRE